VAPISLTPIWYPSAWIGPDQLVLITRVQQQAIVTLAIHVHEFKQDVLADAVDHTVSPDLEGYYVRPAAIFAPLSVSLDFIGLAKSDENPAAVCLCSSRGGRGEQPISHIDSAIILALELI